MSDLLAFAKKLIETILSPLGIMTVLLLSGMVLSLAKRFPRLGHRLLAGGASIFITRL